MRNVDLGKAMTGARMPDREHEIKGMNHAMMGYRDAKSRVLGACEDEVACSEVFNP